MGWTPDSWGEDDQLVWFAWDGPHFSIGSRTSLQTELFGPLTYQEFGSSFTTSEDARFGVARGQEV